MADVMSKDIYVPNNNGTRNKGLMLVAAVMALFAVDRAVHPIAAPSGPDRLGEVIDIVNGTATEDCVYGIAMNHFSRKGTCTPITHGIVAMKSDAGLDFIDRRNEMQLIASVYNYTVDGKTQQRVWTQYPEAMDVVIDAFGKVRRD